jgi:XTP/dITP diphosphohydrolase
MPHKLVLATGNAGKINECQRLLAKAGVRAIPQDELNIPHAEESGLSFIENAILKARHASQYASLPAIADDSGLEVDCLNGAPGIFSARFAGAKATADENNAKLLNLLQGIPNQQRGARFQCVIVYLRHSRDPTPLICQGTWEGQILTKPMGNAGFGYDPLFFVPERQCSAAQLNLVEKNLLSHRGKAMTCLLQHFLS